MENSKIKKGVMRRVYIIYFVNNISNNSAYLLSGIFSVILLACISEHDVWHNMPLYNPQSFITFVWVAIRDTELFIQAIFGATVASLSYLTYKLSYKLSNALSISLSRSAPRVREL